MGQIAVIPALTRWRDQLLGRGEAAITIPVFDGALKPNRRLDEAAVVTEMPEAEDLATDGQTLFVADGQRVVSLANGQIFELARFDRTVTALATMPDGGLVVALDGREIAIVGGRAGGRRWSEAAGKRFVAANALSVRRNGTILVADGSATNPYERWCHDLMSRCKTGRIVELDPLDGSAKEVANNLAYAFGVCESGDKLWGCESWRHRIMSYGGDGSGEVAHDELPGYAARITSAAD